MEGNEWLRALRKPTCARVRDKGRILSAFVVAHPGTTFYDTTFVLYLRTDWRRGYHILKTRRKQRERIYAGGGLGRIAWMLRSEFGFTEPFTVYPAGCEALHRFTGLRPVDRGLSEEAHEALRPAKFNPPWELPVGDPSDADCEPTDGEDPKEA